MTRPAIITALIAGLVAGSALAEGATIKAAVIRVDAPRLPPISRLDLPPADLGFAGARLANADNATTGRFLGQDFTATEAAVAREGAIAAVEAAIAEGAHFIVTLADAPTTLAMADAAAGRALVVNAAAHDDALRNADCRSNLIHTAPSDAMLTDALAQFLVWKRWGRWFLIEGSHPQDKALADAYRRAATKFGAKIVESRVFEDTGGARRTDTGHVQVQAQMPVFTQSAPEHDVVIAADDAGIFAAYLPYHTWDARPVAGSAGLVPRSWHPALEAWGATQFQNRFEAQAGRPMRDEDYQVWMALRILGEAATRTGSADWPTLEAQIRSDKMELAAFKGQKLTIRDWDGQLRQPVLLTTGVLTASVSPQDAFLHQVSTLDTLGTDRPESTCTKGIR